MIVNCNKLKEIITTEKNKTILGIDWGKKCIGLAITDENATFTIPIKPVIQNEIRQKENFWTNLIKEYNPTAIIIGLPEHKEKDGYKNETIESIKEFTNKLNEELISANIEKYISFINEAGTSKSAEEMQNNLLDNEAKITRKKKKENINSLSAKLILDRFI